MNAGEVFVLDIAGIGCSTLGSWKHLGLTVKFFTGQTATHWLICKRLKSSLTLRETRQGGEIKNKLKPGCFLPKARDETLYKYNASMSPTTGLQTSADDKLQLTRWLRTGQLEIPLMQLCSFSLQAAEHAPMPAGWAPNSCNIKAAHQMLSNNASTNSS